MERASPARALSHSTQVRQADRPRDGSQGQPEAQIFRQVHGDEVRFRVRPGTQVPKSGSESDLMMVSRLRHKQELPGTSIAN